MILRAFVFEPNDIVREYLLRVLNQRGYECFAFERAGICAMEHEAGCSAPPTRMCADIIIADVNRSGFPSFEILKHAVQRNCNVPNIALMSGTWLEEHRSYVAKRDYKVLNKPFSTTTLHAWLDECEKRIDRKRELFNEFWADYRGANRSEDLARIWPPS